MYVSMYLGVRSTSPRVARLRARVGGVRCAGGKRRLGERRERADRCAARARECARHVGAAHVWRERAWASALAHAKYSAGRRACPCGAWGARAARARAARAGGRSVKMGRWAVVDEGVHLPSV